MRSLFSKTLLTCFAGASLAVLPLAAFWGGYDDCCTPCCEDGPLTCGAWSVQVKGGVAPTDFSDRDSTYLTIPSLFPAVPNPVISAGKGPSFSRQFDCPWTVGAELAWNASTHIQFFTEYAYQQASGKHRSFTNRGLLFGHKYDDYSNNGLYLGARYYFSTCWNTCYGRLSPFAGFKGGVVWFDTINYGLEIGGVSLGKDQYFKRRTAVSAGLQIGIDWNICENWSAVLTSEFVATGGLHGNRNKVVNPALSNGVTNVSFGGTGTILTFPVTLGVRYTF